MIVVDASVAVKWLLPEPGEGEAQELLRSEKRLIAPAHVRIEVAGAVLRQFREGKLPEQKARTACGLWDHFIQDGTLHLLSIDELFDIALGIAFEARHALADCLYLAAGKKLNVGVITADRTLYERGKRIYKKVSLLSAATTH